MHTPTSQNRASLELHAEKCIPLLFLYPAHVSYLPKSVKNNNVLFVFNFVTWSWDSLCQTLLLTGQINNITLYDMHCYELSLIKNQTSLWVRLTIQMCSKHTASPWHRPTSLCCFKTWSVYFKNHKKQAHSVREIMHILNIKAFTLWTSFHSWHKKITA